MMGNRYAIKGLTFDVFGTVVDWRTTIVNEVSALEGMKPDDAERFADAWRGGQKMTMDRIRSGALPWMNLDAVHRMLLDRLLAEFAIAGITEAEREHLNRIWHRLKPWPDAVEGVASLRQRFIVATLSNGNMSLLTKLSKRAGLTWDCVLSSELVGRYKPEKEVYQMAAKYLDLRPDQVMMVAAHKDDLRAAQNVGFRTAFVPRPMENGSATKEDLETDSTFDIIAHDFKELAMKLEA